MISRLDSSSEQFLNALSGTQRKLNQAQLELTSGKRVNTISDDPDQISSLLQSRAELGNSVQTKSDLGRVKTEVDTAESVMATAVNLVEHARVLAAQGATGTSSAETRKNLADQLALKTRLDRTWSAFFARHGRFTPAQMRAIPSLLDGHNIMLCAPQRAGKLKRLSHRCLNVMPCPVMR